MVAIEYSLSFIMANTNSWINKLIANYSPNIKSILMIDRQVTRYAHINKHTRALLGSSCTIISNYESNQKVFMGTSVSREKHTILYRDYLFSKTLLKGYTYQHVNIFIQTIWIRTCPWKLFLGYHIWNPILLAFSHYFC